MAVVVVMAVMVVIVVMAMDGPAATCCRRYREILKPFLGDGAVSSRARGGGRSALYIKQCLQCPVSQ